MNHLTARQRRWAFPAIAATLAFTLTPGLAAQANAAPAYAVLTQDPGTDYPPPDDTGPDSEPLTRSYETLAAAESGEPNLADGSTVCISGHGANACFKKPGDVLMIKKTSSRFWALASADVFAWDRTRWRYIKTLECEVGTFWPVGRWGKCNFDIWEDSTRNTWGGYGSGIRLYAESDTGITTYRWVRNNDNQPG